MSTLPHPEPERTKTLDETLLAGSGDPLEDGQWEAEVTRRAGLGSQQQAAPQAAAEEEDVTAARGKHLEQLKRQIQLTLQQLKQQQEDSERAEQRRAADAEHAERDAAKHKEELEKSGSSLEFYQHWREQLVAWVGAVGELHTKVEPILSALHDLEAEVAAVSRWQDWENDMIAVLDEEALLDQVVGRQPPPSVYDNNRFLVETDEFGRDVKSIHVRQREKRNQQRQRIRQQRAEQKANALNAKAIIVDSGIRGDESDAFVSDGEMETFRERHMALQDALTVAQETLDEKYTVLQNLVDLFDKWREAYPEEYVQCYASLSLADLMCILVQAELCALNDPWNESEGYNEAKWTSVVHGALETGTLDQPAVERLFEKVVLPAVSDLLEKSGINLVSRRQTRALRDFVTHIKMLLPPDSPTVEKLHRLLTSFVEKSLADIAIPIISKCLPIPDNKEEVEDVVSGARWGQMHRVKKVLLNLLIYLAPILKDDLEFIDLILNFISSKFLFLLSSLQNIEQLGFEETPADAFGTVWKNLVDTGWMGWPEFSLQAAPIRAAASVYNVPQ
jgi:hypothetical protein